MSTAQRGGSGAVGPQQGGQRAASRPSAVRWGQLGAKPPPTDPTDPHQSVARPPPSPPRPSLPGAVAARSLFAKGVCCCPSRCQQGSQGTKRGTGKGAGTQTPNPPPKKSHGDVSASTAQPCALSLSAWGGLWLPTRPHVCPHPMGVPEQCELLGGQHRSCAQRGQRVVGVSATAIGTTMAWGPRCHTTGTAMARHGGHHGTGSRVAQHGGTLPGP